MTDDFFSGRRDAMNIVLDSRKQLGTFQDKLFRHQQKYDEGVHHSRVIGDYQSFYNASDNIYSSSAQSGGNTRPTFADLEALSNERIGIGRYFTDIFARKAVRNGFDFYNWEGDLVKHGRIMKNLYQAKFYTEQLHWVKFELIYGISFLLKYWSSHDKFQLSPPKKPPLAYKAFPPTYMTPTNIVDTGMLWDNQEEWEFRGGKYNSAKIHKDRIEVLCTRPNPNDWIGFSIWEGIYLSASAYLNLIINGIKNLAKYGDVVTAFKMSVPNPSLPMYREYKKLIEDMKASFTFVLGKDEEIQFLDTKIGKGMTEFGEFLKEDMAAGTGLPLNQVYGRADGGGLAGAGALISKQGELETTSNYQADLSDNYWEMINRYWPVENEFVKFRLDYQKSDRARYEEEALQWENEIRKAQYESIKLNNLMSAMQFQQMLENPQLQIGDQTGGNIGSQTGGKIGSQSGASAPNLNTVIKANQDFITRNSYIINGFKPRIIDIEYRDKNGGIKK